MSSLRDSAPSSTTSESRTPISSAVACSTHAGTDNALYTYFESVRPFLDQWASRHSHLREVTKSDIYPVLGPPRGYQRNNAIHAPQSLFRFAPKRGLVFTNPTIGVQARQIDPEMMPITEPEIRAIEQLASKPAQRVAVALAAEHAARTGVIRNLTLDDLDISKRHATVAEHLLSDEREATGATETGQNR